MGTRVGPGGGRESSREVIGWPEGVGGEWDRGFGRRAEDGKPDTYSGQIFLNRK